MSDDIGRWLPARAVATLRAHGIATLADLTVRGDEQGTLLCAAAHNYH
ncbi:hypothetical protein ACV229_26740 [Burkholderia sp. MR1-5-21]